MRVRVSGSGEATLVILPTYNESGSLAEIVARLRAAVPAADLLIVDDASPDGTGKIADALAAADPHVCVAHRPGKLGLGTAYVLGFRHARGDRYRYVVEMDADGSHLPEQLPNLLIAARAGAGLVIGTRWIEGGRISGWPRYRRWISRTGTRVARVALRSRLRDITSGYRVIDTSWLAQLNLGQITSHGYGFQVELAWTLERLGCPIAEVPITFVERRTGRSKMSIGIVFEALGRVLAWGWQLRFAPGRLPRAVGPARAEETPSS
ncbi:polyprenol monophosphomannose synthase [Leucobacter sp. W1478]|uniref:polyprenol monophosphomannose synthase n=1 Tax=Leucobacter sp. W1478 TaxID=3439065 RepID=UPI003F2BC9F9